MATQILPTGIKNFGSTTIDNIVLDTSGGVDIDDGHLVVTHGGNVTVNSALQVNSALNVTGAATLGGTLTIDGAVTIDDRITADGTITARQLTNNALSAFEAVDINGTRFKVTGAGVLSIYDNTLTENITLEPTGRAIFLEDISIGTDENQGLITINNHNGSDDALLKIRQASDFETDLAGFVIDVRNQANNQGRTLIQRGLDIRFITGTGNPSETARFTDNHLLIGYNQDFGSGSSGDLLQLASEAGGHLLTGRNESSVTVNESMGLWRGYSYGGSVWEETARISMQADSTHASGDKPGRLMFSTTSAGLSSPTERFRIDSVGGTYNTSSFSSADIATGKTLAELPCLGNTRKRLYSFNTPKTAAINAFEAVFKISFTGNNNDTAHFRISANTRNSISTTGNIGHTYCDFTFSTGNGTTPVLETHETVVDAKSYNSGFCEPIQDGNDVWIFIKSNSTSGSAKLDLDSIQLEVTTANPSSFTLYSVSGTPAANGVSDPRPITGHTFHNNISIDGAVQNFIRAGSVSFGGASTVGEFTITIEGLKTLTGGQWYKAGLFVGFSGIRQNSQNDQIALYYFGIRGLSAWDTLLANPLLNTITASITSSTADSVTITFTPSSTSSYGSVFAIAQGNGASPRIVISS